MALICYDTTLRFHKAARVTLNQANAIIAEYAEKGFGLTLRQLYYQFVARGLVPENTLNQYKRLGDIISRGRIAGLVDWNAISDMTRSVRDTRREPDRAYLPYLNRAAARWTIDWWEGQQFRPIVMIEKDALAGVIDGVCRKYQIPYIPCRGYMSQSEQWRLGQKIRKQTKEGFTPVVFHLGDHDPSGIDMTRDNESRLWMFGGHVEVRRLALNYDQVQEFNPPPNPAKPLDSRTANYRREFGDYCWELDALEPQFIAGLVEKEVLTVLDMPTFEARKKENEVQTKEIVDLVGTLVWPPKPPDAPPEPPPERDPYEWIDPWK